MITRRLLGFLVALGFIYAFASMYSLLNQFFDDSSKKIERVTVVEKRTRYSLGGSVSVLTVQGNRNAIFDIDVLDELAGKVAIGSELSIVDKKGFFGKRWRQDEEFYDLLAGTRTIQGFLYLAFDGLLAALWLYLFKAKFMSISRALGGLGVTLVLGFGVFWIFL